MNLTDPALLTTAGSVLTVTPTSLQCDLFGVELDTYLNTGFTSSGGAITGGLINASYYRFSSVLMAQITGISVSAVTVHNFYPNNDGQGLAEFLLSSADTITGSAADELLTGYGDNDTIFGEGGNDTLFGGDFSDYIYGGSGNDTLYGGSGGDLMTGGLGNDMFYGGGDSDDLVFYQTETGVNGVIVKLALNTATDTFRTTDAIFGVSIIDATNRVDSLTGSAGDDVFRGLAGADIINGGAGSDEVRYDFDAQVGGPGGVTVDLAAGTAIDGFSDTDILTSIERAWGSNSNDLLSGYFEDNVFAGLWGDDTLIGLDGNDFLNGGRGSDTFFGGNGFDTATCEFDTGPFGVFVDLASGIATDSW